MQNRYPVLKVLLLVFQIKSGPAMEITAITWAGYRKDIRKESMETTIPFKVYEGPFPYKILLRGP